MSTTITGGRLVMTADGTGYHAARRTLSPAPTNATMMCFYFRCWFDSYTATNEENAVRGWNAAWAFGFNFNRDFPEVGSWGGYFGPANITTNAGDYGLVKNWRNGPEFGDTDGYNRFWFDILDGGGDTVFMLGKSDSGYRGNSDNLARTVTVLPGNPTQGAAFTGVWLIKKSYNAGRILISLGYNLEGLGRQKFDDARTNAATVWACRDEAVTDGDPGTWRLNGTMNFPRYFHIRFPSYTSGKKFVVDHMRIEYRDFNEKLLSFI